MGNKIDDKDVVHKGTHQAAERLVFRVFQIGITILLALKSKDEAVGEAFIPLLFANVGAPLERLDPGDFLLQGCESFLDLFNVFGSRSGFELEANDVVNFTGSACGVGQANYKARQKES